MNDNQPIEMSLPLDDDAFLRRACSTCEREFKWFNSLEGAGEPVPTRGYYCPYCRVQSPDDSWFTEEQVRLATNRVARNILGPELEKMSRTLERSSRGSLFRLDVDYDKPDQMDPLVEPNDMRRVDFACHPNEPVKVLDAWTRPVHCLICSRETSPVPG